MEKEFHEMKKFIKHKNRLEKNQNDIKIPRDVVNEIIGRPKSSKVRFLKTMIIDGQEIFNHGKIANCFNNFFV